MRLGLEGRPGESVQRPGMLSVVLKMNGKKKKNPIGIKVGKKKKRSFKTRPD